MTHTTPQTLTACREVLMLQGCTVTGYKAQDGRRYRVANFRGGRCFDGTLQELREELVAGWLRYC